MCISFENLIVIGYVNRFRYGWDKNKNKNKNKNNIYIALNPLFVHGALH